jgi:hypothetical protein
MGKVLKTVFSALALVAVGCASYQATPLTTLSTESVQPREGITISAKSFDTAACQTYLDRNVIRKGFQPVQIFIQNSSDQSYMFTLGNITLAHATPERVADTVHTSTVGRVLGYGLPGILLPIPFLPLVIPSVVDGIKSMEANQALDNDFASKAAKDQIIPAHSSFNKIVFVPVSEYQQKFEVTLIEKESGKTKTFNVVAS